MQPIRPEKSASILTTDGKVEQIETAHSFASLHASFRGIDTHWIGISRMKQMYPMADGLSHSRKTQKSLFI